MASLPATSKSLTYLAPSSPPHVISTPLTPPTANELLVKIHAAAINPVDIQIWNAGLIGWLAGKKEKGIGRDFSGVIVAVGNGVKGWKEGDEVFGLCSRPVCVCFSWIAIVVGLRVWNAWLTRE
jgi:NADPH:quinone reductase-like Zn-dependent oxidoreductase